MEEKHVPGGKAECTVHHIDAFSAVAGKGNPAGVVPDARGLDEASMQRIAAAVGFNETVFVSPSPSAEYRFRYFTPGQEMSLCGHATVAATYLLCRDGGVSRSFTIETRAGILPITYDAAGGLTTMRHAAPEFRAFGGKVTELAAVMGVDPARVGAGLPVVYGSTGTWTLLVPVDSVETLMAMRPDTGAFPGVLREMPRTSIHPFVVTLGAAEGDFVARHFSSPYSGTVEDPVTGTASGVMGAYAMEHLFPDASARRFVVRQGASVNRDGKVVVDVHRDNGGMRVSITGEAAEACIMTVAY